MMLNLDLNETMRDYQVAADEDYWQGCGEAAVRLLEQVPVLVEELRAARTKIDAQAAELRNIRPEFERLRAFVPSPELMQWLAHLDEDYARHVDEAPAGDEYYSYVELPQAWRIEEAQE